MVIIYTNVSLKCSSHCRMRPYCYITYSFMILSFINYPFSSVFLQVESNDTSLSLSDSLSLPSSFIFLCLSFSVCVCLSFCLCSCTAACLYVCHQHKQKHYGSERATSILLTHKEPQEQGGAIYWWDSSDSSIIHVVIPLFAHWFVSPLIHKLSHSVSKSSCFHSEIICWP